MQIRNMLNCGEQRILLDGIKERHFRNIFIYIFPKFISFGLNLVALPILTRVLSPEDFGVITLSMAVPMITVGVVTLGLTHSVPRYYFEYRNDTEKLKSFYFTIQTYLFLVLIISSVIIYFVKDFLSLIVTQKNEYGTAILISYITTYVGSINMIYLRIYQNMEKAIFYATSVSLQTITNIIMSLIFVWYFRMTYMGILYGLLCGAALSCLIMFIKFNKESYASFNFKMLNENMKYGLQVVPKTFSGLINRYFDKYLLNSTLSMSVVGVYNIGQTITNAVDVMMSNVWMSFQPLVYKTVFDQENNAADEIGRLFTIFSYITFIPVMLLILFSKEILHIIAPPAYYGAENVMIILAIGIASQSFGMYVSVQYAYSKKPFWIFPATVVGSLANIGLNILLIPKYGLIGASFAAMFSTTIINIILTAIGQKLYRIIYEWRAIIALYSLLIIAASFMMLFDSNSNLFVFYSIKLLLIFLFIYIGIKIKILTKQLISKMLRFQKPGFSS